MTDNTSRYAWLAKNRDRVNAKRRAARALNAEKARAKDREKYRLNPNPKKEAARRYKEKRPGISGHWNRKRMYGLTPAQYAEMLNRQNNVCAICLNPETAKNNRGTGLKSLAVDHDHLTGKVRGLLCGRCNAVLGYANDETDRLARAMEYLAEHRGES